MPSGDDDMDNKSSGYDDLDMDALELEGDLQDADLSYEADDAGLDDALDDTDYNDDDLADFDETPVRGRGGNRSRGAKGGRSPLMLGVAGIAILAAAGAFFVLGGGKNNAPAPQPQTSWNADQAQNNYDGPAQDITLMDGLPQPPGARNDADNYPDLSEPALTPLPGAQDMTAQADPLMMDGAAPTPDFPPPPALADDVPEAVDIGMNDISVPEVQANDTVPEIVAPVSEPEESVSLASDASDTLAPPVIDAPAPDMSALSRLENADMGADISSNATVSSVPMGVNSYDAPAPAPVTEGETFPATTTVSSSTPTPMPGDVAAQAPAAPVRAASESYYDSGMAPLPRRELAGAVGPRQVDPSVEPGQRYVIVDSVQVASDPEAKLEAASRALKLGRYDAALEMYDALYARNSRDVRILMGRAVAQQNTGRLESAIRSYEEVLDRDPKNTEAMINMLGLIRNQYPEVALRRMMDLTAEHPDNAGLAAQIGVIQGEMGNYRDAIRFLNRAAQLEPNNPQHWFNMAVIADREGGAREAVQYYEQALSVDSVHGAGRSLPRETIYKRLSALRARL